MAVNFKLSEEKEFMDQLEDEGCDDVTHYHSKDDLDQYAMKNFNLYDEDPKEECKQILRHAPHPSVSLNRMLLPSSTIFAPHFFRYKFVPNTTKSDSSAGKASSRGPVSDGNRNEEAAWQSARKAMDDSLAWHKRIEDQLHLLSESPTGDIILQFIATLFLPGEIKVTNRNPTRLSADVHTLEVNIPSVPRFICYYNAEQKLINSQLWMALGHELIHLVHQRLGLHEDNNSPMEEENTVQGIITKGDNIDHSLVAVNGHLWHLTENQFRKEHHIDNHDGRGPVPIDKRNGYGSVPVCASFEKEGCELFNQYGDETCQVLQDGADPKAQEVLSKIQQKMNTQEAPAAIYRPSQNLRHPLPRVPSIPRTSRPRVSPVSRVSRAFSYDPSEPSPLDILQTQQARQMFSIPSFAASPALYDEYFFPSFNSRYSSQSSPLDLFDSGDSSLFRTAELPTRS